MPNKLDFIFQKDAQSVFDIFTDLFGIRIAFFSPSGEELKVGHDRPICRYCGLLRTKLNFEEKCLTLDRKMRSEAVRQKKMVTYHCHGGMIEAVTPLFLDDDFIGFIMIGQMRVSGEVLSPAIGKQWKQKIETDQLQEAYREAPSFTEAYMKNIFELFRILIKFIVDKHLIDAKGLSAIHEVINYMKDHVERNLSVEDAAALIFSSKSSFYHKFKDVTGKSFKQYQIDAKLAKADEYLSRHPELSVKEVALKLGYQDPFYFSRLYSKNRGISPGARQKKT